jgi:molybdopterin converting factor small subunit
MPRVIFTSNLQRHVRCPERDVSATTVRGALEEVFADAPTLRDYVLDEQGHVRKHVVIYVNGRGIVDRERQADAIPPSGEVYVFQALSGG